MYLLSSILNKLKKPLIQVILIITFYLLLANSLPLEIHRFFYTTSIFIKDLLILLLPITVGFFIANTVSGFERKAPIFIVFIILFEALSNFSCVWFAFLSGHIAVDHLPILKLSSQNFDFTPLWQMPNFKPYWWSADKGVIFGLLIGCICALTKSNFLKYYIQKGKEIAEWILTNIFSKLIPLFILGFVAKMHETKMLNQIISNYSMFLVWLLMFLLIYISTLFLIGNGFSIKAFFRSIKNLLPATTIAFTSSSSLSTMPWTIEGTKKNLTKPDFAAAIIPTTTNIQQVGDCIANSFLCLLIYNNFFGHNPSFVTWLTFSIIFVLGRFATAAVLGGSIFIMLPIYEKYLSFNAEMIAIILAFNVILDPIITSCNVIGNGAMCQLYEKVWSFFNNKKEVEKN